MCVFQLGPIVLAAALLVADFHQLQQPPASVPSEVRDARLPAVVINDNRQPAGSWRMAY